jgi:hypothetical protein
MTAIAFLPDRTEFTVFGNIKGEVAWTAAGRKMAREKSGICPDLIAIEEVVKRLGVTSRTIIERARAKGVGGKIDRTWWFKEAEIYALRDEGNAACSTSKSGQDRHTGTSEGQSVDKLFTRLQKKQTKQLLDDLRNPSKSKSRKPQGENVVPLPSKKPQRST